MTIKALDPLETYDAPMPATERRWRCVSDAMACSDVAVYELPAFPFSSRWSAAKRVAYGAGTG